MNTVLFQHVFSRIVVETSLGEQHITGRNTIVAITIFSDGIVTLFSGDSEISKSLRSVIIVKSVQQYVP